MPLVLEYIWMCLSNKYFVSLAAGQLLDKFVAYYALILDLFATPPRSSILTLFFLGGGDYIVEAGLIRGIGNSNIHSTATRPVM